jgi:hypothetical protein
MKGDRERRRPTARRLFARAKQTLVKLEGEKLRLTVKPGEVRVPRPLKEVVSSAWGGVLGGSG